MQRVWFGALAALMGFGLSACATASDNKDAPRMAADSGKICKRVPVMGSNFPTTVCSTAEEWAQFDRQTRESVDAYDKDRKQGNTQGAFEN
jgi:hypothetical protein